MVIENIGGAGGLIAAGKVAHAKADGYTLLLASDGQVSLAPLLNTSMSYDPDKDLVPIIHPAARQVSASRHARACGRS